MKQTEKIKILLIEDNPDNSKLFSEYLDEISQNHYEFTLAESLKQATELINRHRFSIIFTNLNLPDSSRLNTLNHILDLSRPCPVIVFTGPDNSDLGIEAVKAGAADYLYKPGLNSQLIEKTINHAIERKNLLQQIADSETRYRRMFDYSSLGKYRSTASGELLEVNQAFANIFGYDSPDEIYQRNKDVSSQLYLEPKEREEILADFLNKKVTSIHREVQFLRKDGSAFTGLLHMRPSVGETTDNLTIEGYVQDITKEKKAHEQVKESLIFMKELMDNIPSPVYAKDNMLRYTGCNKEYEKFIGLNEHELVGKTLMEIRKHEDVVFLDKMDRELLKTKQRQVFEHTIRFATGYERNMIFYKNVITNRNGQLIGIIGIMVDITDKKNAMEQLRGELSINEAMSGLSQQLLEPGISLHEIATLVLDYTKSFTKSEHGYAATIDPENGDIVVHTYTEMGFEASDAEEEKIRFPKIKGKYSNLWGQALNTQKPLYNNQPDVHESLGDTPLGDIPLDNFLSVPVMIQDELAGQITLANAEEPYNKEDLENVLRISRLYSLAIEKVRRMDEIITSKEQAEMSDKLKSAFLANMSHEIRTPLNAIVGFSQMLGDESVSLEETMEFKKVIIKNTDLLLHLISDIIEMSMIEAGELKIQPEFQPVKNTINQIFESWKYKDEVVDAEDRIKFNLMHPDNDQDKSFNIDFLRFNQILNNLIMNAFRFTNSGEITVGYRYPDNGEVEIFIRDTGIGISKEYQSIIFDRFRQVDELRVRPFSGTGLGLAITKKLTENMGGTISVESAPGQGSTFYLSFPVTKTRIKSQKPELLQIDEPQKLNGTIEGKHMLIVEDNDSSFEFLEILLRRKGAKIQRAITGHEAIEKQEKNNNDIILMDLQLPEMSGFDAIRKIRENNHHIPIIVQTAFSEQSEREKAFDAGCDAYLVKPITRKTLEATLLKFCRK